MSEKVYVCEACGTEYAACPTEIDRAAREPGCFGRVTACYVCGNCGQWARPRRVGESLYWDCMNECAAHGLAELHRAAVEP